MRVTARLKPGISTSQAQAAMPALFQSYKEQHPETADNTWSPYLVSAAEDVTGDLRPAFVTLLAAVSAVLLIACSNVANLLLVRLTGRKREIALRMALGADRWRLVRQLVTEGLVLALASAGLGLIVSYWGLQGLIALAPVGVLPAYAAPTINMLTFLFAIVVAIGSGFFFGLIPAIRGSRVDLVDSLKNGARGSADGFGRGSRLDIQQVLVIGETAVALILLVGAGLFVRSLERQLAVTPGFDARNVVRARLVVPARYTAGQRVQFAQQLEERFASIPSVRAVAMGADLPLAGPTSASFLRIAEVDRAVRFYRHIVAPNFLSALGIKLMAGRTFSVSDREGAPAVVMINASMARRFWPNESPIGKRIQLGGDRDAPEATIVGVATDVRFRDLTTPLGTTEPDVYLPFAQRPSADMLFAVRSTASLGVVANAMRREVAALDPTVPLFRVEPMASLLAQQTANGRFASSLLAVFGVAALALTAVGLYGVLAFLVSLRRREIGIRLALGATNSRVVGSVMGQGLKLVALGLVIGMAGAAIATRWIATQLYGVGAHDPLVFAGTALLLLAVTAVASSLPARRAAGVDPQIALRAE